MTEKDMVCLLDKAREAKKNSYSPYSGFSVGAALLGKSGKIYLGCNIENSSYSPTCCAERAALFSAVSNGERAFLAIAIVGDSSPCMPCGVCRQALSEFCSEDMPVIVEDGERKPLEYTLGELLPKAFGFKK